MIWCLSGEGEDLKGVNQRYGNANFTNTITSAAAADAAKFRGRAWLVLNEPDLVASECGTEAVSGSSNQVYQEPEEIAARYVVVYDLIKAHDPTALVLVGGLMWPYVSADSDCGPTYGTEDSWWDEFISQTIALDRLDAVEGIHVHGYPESVFVQGCTVTGDGDFPTAGEWCVDEAVIGLTHWYTACITGKGIDVDEVWVTEIGAKEAVCTSLANHYDGITYTHQMTNPAYTDVLSNVMNPFQTWFESVDNPGYTNIFWFMPFPFEPKPDPWAEGLGKWWCDFLENENGDKLSVTGVDWRDWNP